MHVVSCVERPKRQTTLRNLSSKSGIFVLCVKQHTDTNINTHTHAHTLTRNPSAVDVGIMVG